MSLCLFGAEGEGPCLLSADERQRLHTVHNTIQQNCSHYSNLVPELVHTCEPLNRVVAEMPLDMPLVVSIVGTQRDVQ